jgi:hypothetical protein
MIKPETLHQRQRRTKPNVEDAIRERLGGDEQARAMDYAAFVKRHKLSFAWAGTQNTWKATSKGKPIAFIRIDTAYNEKRAWSANVRLHHFREYEAELMAEGLGDLIFPDLSHCNCSPNKCGNAKNDTVFGRDFMRCCYTLGFGGREPDDDLMGRIKLLFEYEIKARN